VFNGNPFQKNFGEALPKGFVHFKTKTEKNVVDFKHRFVDNHPSFTLQTIVIETAKDFSRLKNDDSIRYKLLVSPEVMVPADLRILYPNITGGIFNSDTKKQDVNTDGPVVEQLGMVSQVTRIKPTTGLKNFLIAEGYSKKEILLARSIVTEAMNELGIS
jgi:hypothetical protein